MNTLLLIFWGMFLIFGGFCGGCTSSSTNGLFLLCDKVSEITPCSLRGLDGVLGIKPGSTVCKTGTLSATLLHRFLS